MRAHPGGFGNSLPVATNLLPGEIGAATLLCRDPNGLAFFKCMEEAGVDTGGIIWNTDLPEDQMFEILDPKRGVVKVSRDELSTGMSFVCVDPASGDPLIYFSPGVLQAFGREHVNLDYAGQADAAIISYATLLRSLDKDHGIPMAGLIRDLRARNVLTVLDTHSIKGADYSCLDEPLKEVDIFGCNIGEAMSITGLENETPVDEIVDAIGSKMNIDGSRSRIVAVTSKEKGAILAYYKPGETKPEIVQVPACNVEVKDATGAGDTFKVGLVAYITEHLEEYKSGRLNIREATQFGNATAASYIAGTGTEYVGSFEQTMAYMNKQYPETGPHQKRVKV
ncbi:MAG: carbohydrate kinase family protein [Methanobacteriota archaeon]